MGEDDVKWPDTHKKGILMKKIFTYPLFWIVVISLLPLWALFVPGLPFTHDGPDHVARIANFYRSLSEGNLVPRWAGNLNWGYGHPILMFLYPLPSYLASIFHGVGFSFVTSVKLVFGVTFILSGVAMYAWMSAAFGKRPAFIGSLLYLFAPYRFVDLYVRGAIGEHVAFIFPPLILYFLYKLAISKNKVYNGVGLSLSFAALILSHNAIAIMFLPVIALYGIYLYFFEAKERLLVIGYWLLVIVLGFGLSAFFWIPAFFEGKYTLRDIVTAGETMQRFVPWNWFLYSPWNYGGGNELSKSLGLMQWVGIIASLFVIWKSKDKKVRIILIASTLLLFLSLYIMTASSKSIWSAITLLQKFQFPWRFLSLSTFLAAVIGGISMRTKKNLLLIGYCLLVIGLTIQMWHPKGYQIKPESYYSGIYPSTTDTGESSPIWSVRFMEHAPVAPLEVIDGLASITQGVRNTTVHEYTVKAQKPTLMIENTVYFPGWKIYVDGIETEIQFQNQNYRGLMTFSISEGVHQVRVVFEDTKIRKTANMISAVTLALLALIGTGALVWIKRK